jgi:hypothetical protein
MLTSQAIVQKGNETVFKIIPSLQNEWLEDSLATHFSRCK